MICDNDVQNMFGATNCRKKPGVKSCIKINVRYFKQIRIFRQIYLKKKNNIDKSS